MPWLSCLKCHEMRAQPAGYDENGNTYYHCEACGALMAILGPAYVRIPAPDTASVDRLDTSSGPDSAGRPSETAPGAPMS